MFILGAIIILLIRSHVDTPPGSVPILSQSEYIPSVALHNIDNSVISLNPLHCTVVNLEVQSFSSNNLLILLIEF